MPRIEWAIAIDLPFVVAGQQASADVFTDGHAPTFRGVNHVGLN